MSAELQTKTLAGSICIRCGHEPLESEGDEWWCPECWQAGFIPADKAVDKPDALLAACRAIVDVQRSQLRAKRAGEALGSASILGPIVMDLLVEQDHPPAWDDSEPGRPTQTLDELIAEWDEELGRGYKPPVHERWILSDYPELDWLVHIHPQQRAPYRDSHLRDGLKRNLPDVPNHVWKVLLDG